MRFVQIIAILVTMMVLFTACDEGTGGGGNPISPANQRVCEEFSDASNRLFIDEPLNSQDLITVNEGRYDSSALNAVVSQYRVGEFVGPDVASSKTSESGEDVFNYLFSYHGSGLPEADALRSSSTQNLLGDVWVPITLNEGNAQLMNALDKKVYTFPSNVVYDNNYFHLTPNNLKITGRYQSDASVHEFAKLGEEYIHNGFRSTGANVLHESGTIKISAPSNPLVPEIKPDGVIRVNTDQVLRLRMNYLSGGSEALDLFPADPRTLSRLERMSGTSHTILGSDFFYEIKSRATVVTDTFQGVEIIRPPVTDLPIDPNVGGYIIDQSNKQYARYAYQSGLKQNPCGGKGLFFVVEANGGQARRYTAYAVEMMEGDRIIFRPLDFVFQRDTVQYAKQAPFAALTRGRLKVSDVMKVAPYRRAILVKVGLHVIDKAVTAWAIYDLFHWIAKEAEYVYVTHNINPSNTLWINDAGLRNTNFPRLAGKIYAMDDSGESLNVFKDEKAQLEAQFRQRFPEVQALDHFNYPYLIYSPYRDILQAYIAASWHGEAGIVDIFDYRSEYMHEVDIPYGQFAEKFQVRCEEFNKNSKFRSDTIRAWISDSNLQSCSNINPNDLPIATRVLGFPGNIYTNKAVPYFEDQRVEGQEGKSSQEVWPYGFLPVLTFAVSGQEACGLGDNPSLMLFDSEDGDAMSVPLSSTGSGYATGTQDSMDFTTYTIYPIQYLRYQTNVPPGRWDCTSGEAKVLQVHNWRLESLPDRLHITPARGNLLESTDIYVAYMRANVGDGYADFNILNHGALPAFDSADGARYIQVWGPQVYNDPNLKPVALSYMDNMRQGWKPCEMKDVNQFIKPVATPPTPVAPSGQPPAGVEPKSSTDTPGATPGTSPVPQPSGKPFDTGVECAKAGEWGNCPGDVCECSSNEQNCCSHLNEAPCHAKCYGQNYAENSVAAGHSCGCQ